MHSYTRPAIQEDSRATSYQLRPLICTTLSIVKLAQPATYIHMTIEPIITPYVGHLARVLMHILGTYVYSDTFYMRPYKLHIYGFTSSELFSLLLGGTAVCKISDTLG